MDNLMLTSVLSMASLAVIFAAILAFADKKLKVEEDPMVDKITHILPGVNCGACGYLSCHAFAEKIAKENEDPGKCKVMGEETREQLFALVGREGQEQHPMIPIVRCAAGTEHKVPLAEYKGVPTCSAANLAFGAGMECEYGCMGLGDCVKACPFEALYMENALPRVDMDKCTGCGKCAEACPRGIITMEEKKYERLYYVACSSHDDVLRVRTICKVGCIACGICVKLSPEGFFKMEDNLSREEISKQKKQEETKKVSEKCPTKVIKEI